MRTYLRGSPCLPYYKMDHVTIHKKSKKSDCDTGKNWVLVHGAKNWTPTTLCKSEQVMMVRLESLILLEGYSLYATTTMLHWSLTFHSAMNTHGCGGVGEMVCHLLRLRGTAWLFDHSYAYAKLVLVHSWLIPPWETVLGMLWINRGTRRMYYCTLKNSKKNNEIKAAWALYSLYEQRKQIKKISLPIYDGHNEMSVVYLCKQSMSRYSISQILWMVGQSVWPNMDKFQVNEMSARGEKKLLQRHFCQINSKNLFYNTA